MPLQVSPSALVLFSLLHPLLSASLCSPPLTVLLYLQSAEEIAQFTTDESLSELDRAVAFCKTGFPVQRLSLVTVLPRLIETYHNEAFDKIFPLLVRALSGSVLDTRSGGLCSRTSALGALCVFQPSSSPPFPSLRLINASVCPLFSSSP